jgi:peptidoglycan/LPS O-acetylase OafA/YrhL
VATPQDDRRAGDTLPESSYRGDIQGLRAVAVLLVVFNHAGLTFLGGGYIGVDVFFVVSGFLITGLLLRDYAERGRIRFLNFYSRRARRILPAAALTLIATDIAAQLFLNYVRARSAIEDSIWAAMFAANIQFERIGADYFASGAPPSPIQHFWSLAVEEQFYLFWPALLALLLAGAGWIAHRRNRSKVSIWPVAAGLGVIILASLWWAITQTRNAPSDAYFSAFTRAWELGSGAVLAIGATAVARVPRRVRAALSWLGLAGILLSAVWFSGTTPFPGVAAILPVGSTVLVVAGGTGAVSRIGASALLGLRPFRFVGDVSYGFYLWHWPFLVIAAGYSLTPLTMWVKLGLIVTAFVTAVGTYFAYENPIRRAHNLWGRRGDRALILWPTSITAVVLVGLLGFYSIDARVSAQEYGSGLTTALPFQGTPSPSPNQVGSDPNIPDVAGAVAAAYAGAAIPSPLSPPISKLSGDVGVSLPANCIVLVASTIHNSICPQADLSSGRTMVVFGDSHAWMWLPALIPAARNAGWKLIPIIKSACTAPLWIYDQADPTCPPWYTWAVGEVKGLHPDVVVLGVEDYSGAAWESNIRNTIGAYRATGARVILLGDPPGPPIAPTDCLLSPAATMKTCTFPADPGFVQREERAALFGADYIPDMTWFCFQGECPMVVGHTITHRDLSHISRSYASLLVEPLGKALNLNGA